MYAEDYNGRFSQGFTIGNQRTVQTLATYHKCDDDILTCPNATKPWVDEYGNSTGLQGTFLGSYPHGATSTWRLARNRIKGSYGINGYSNDPPKGSEGHVRPADSFYRGPNVKEAAYAPLWMDAIRYNGYPLEMDTPPPNDGERWNDNAQMGRYCINRHSGFAGCLFLDYSARKVGMKELWTLKWHRGYNQAGPWTKAGGVTASDWPDWIRPFKEY